MRLLIVVLAIPTLVVGWQWWSDRSTEHLLAPVSSEIAGREVAVDCQTVWGALVDTLPRHGEVRFDASGIPENRIFLTHDTCDRLDAFAGTSHHPELDCLQAIDWSAPRPLAPGDPCYARASRTIYALLTLAHEAYHTAGVQNEALANCFAVQGMGYAAAGLGASVEEATLVARAMDRLLPYQGDAYRTTECVRGSPLDLHPDTPAFPTELPLAPPKGRGGTHGLAVGA